MGIPELSTFDLEDDLRSTFGMSEFEWAIRDIIKYLRDDTQKMDDWLMTEPGTGWGKKFRLDTIRTISPPLFAMLCGCGWIEIGFFPKYVFKLSEQCLERLGSPQHGYGSRHLPAVQPKDPRCTEYSPRACAGSGRCVKPAHGGDDHVFGVD